MKRKISYEQDLALARGRQTARANQRRRVAERQAQEKAREERELREREEAAKPVRCPECGRHRRHDEFCSRPVQLVEED